MSLLLMVSKVSSQTDFYALWEEQYNLGLSNLNDEKIEQALKHLDSCYQIIQELDEIKGWGIQEIMIDIEKDSEYYLGDTFFLLGFNYYLNGDFIKALQFYNKDIKVILEVHGKHHPRYILSRLGLANLYFAQNKLKRANQILNELDKDVKGITDRKHSKYLRFFSNTASTCEKLGYLEDSLRISEFALDLLKNSNSENGVNYVLHLNRLGNSYITLGLFEEGLEHLYQAKETCEEMLGTDSQHYPTILNNIASTLNLMGNYSESLDMIVRSLEATKKIHGIYHVEYGNRLSNIGGILYNLGRYEEANAYFLKAIKNTVQTVGKSDPIYAYYTYYHALNLDALGSYDQAITMFEESLEILNKNFGKEHFEYGVILAGLGGSLYKKNDLNRAEQVTKEALSLISVSFKKDHFLYGTALSRLGSIHMASGKYDQAETELLEAQEIFKTNYGIEHQEHINILGFLIELYILKGDNRKAEILIDQYITLLMQSLQSVFNFSNEAAKAKFLSKNSGRFDQVFSYIKDFDDNPNLVKKSFDLSLMLKGILLKNSKNVISKLTALKEFTINNQLKDYKIIRSRISQLEVTPLVNRKVDIDSLKEIMSAKETELVKIYTDRFKDEDPLSSSWDAIVHNLDNDEVAIEFMHFNHFGLDKDENVVQYLAFVIRNDFEAPEVISIFKENELSSMLLSIPKKELYQTIRGSVGTSVKNDKTIYNLIIGPIEKALTGTQTVYFSPSGILNSMQLKGLFNSYQELDCVQLSSISQLKFGLTEPKNNSVLLVGGVNYNLESEDSSASLIDKIEDSVNDESNPLSNQTASWNYLPGTLKETEQLNMLFEKEKTELNWLKGSNASEESFKDIDSNSPNIIHIATHGFYFEPLSDSKDFSSKKIEDLNIYKTSNNPLIRTGLILAGANEAWIKGNKSNSISEDGILTALEISNLNLSNTDLVVLSACDTGLGDIQGSEGVYGLQRAFKMAGVDIIIMSLWQLPDKETSEFMNLFYSNWLNNQNETIRTAFKNTQEEMKKKYPDNPSTWAAFVLME